ncbi:universal stress protein [Myxococcus sp. K15C18031901]|uniref:universal stress protein n=1 Tax=Myxococcus dinghuensis TaxID=2906761 RepID=UPI0020A73F52|nr:universal stress protein [Myxococcus dinghuensis]MCP3102577.1 universal stress protein [Myxococcus dinghuensis]
MTILCATNFSDVARRASDVAAELARKAGVPLLLVHVLNTNSARAFGDALVRAAEAALTDERRRLERSGAKVGWELLTGEPEREVANLARARAATLVVTASPTHEAPFLGVGGTVDRLAQALDAPLLAVRDARSLEAWVRGERPLKVLLGVDHSLPFEAARDWVKGLRAFGAVDVLGGRVVWPDAEYRRLGLTRPMEFTEVTPELQSVLKRETEVLLSPLAHGGAAPRVFVQPGLGRIADSLVELAAVEQVDLLVVGTHHRRALGKMWSVSHHALRLASMSVACVPAQAALAGMDAPLPAFHDVLVATDFSDTGNRAVAYACGLVSPGGTVHLVHVAETDRELAAEAQRLEALVPREAEATGRRVRVEVLVGGKDTVTALLQAAERRSADAIVLGTHGRTGLKRAVLGSVAQAVLARTERPVLLVRPPTT